MNFHFAIDSIRMWRGYKKFIVFFAGISLSLLSRFDLSFANRLWLFSQFCTRFWLNEYCSRKVTVSPLPKWWDVQNANFECNHVSSSQIDSFNEEQRKLSTACGQFYKPNDEVNLRSCNANKVRSCSFSLYPMKLCCARWFTINEELRVWTNWIYILSRPAQNLLLCTHSAMYWSHVIFCFANFSYLFFTSMQQCNNDQIRSVPCSTVPQFHVHVANMTPHMSSHVESLSADVYWDALKKTNGGAR